MIEEDIVTALQGHGGLSALIGSRVYPVTLPDKVALPAVVYQRISAVREYAFGDLTAAAAVTRFQFDCWALTALSAAQVAAQLRLALAGMLDAYDVTVENDFDDWEPEAKRFRRIVDALFAHSGVNV
jgi:hypothetical protein